MKCLAKLGRNVGWPFCLVGRFFWWAGLHAIWLKAKPQKDALPPTFVLWVSAIYITAYGVADQRYENRLGRIEARASLVMAQIVASPHSVGSVASAQAMTRPRPPDRFSLCSIFSSLWGEEERDQPIVMALRAAVVNHKDKLNRRDLSGADLRGADLREANLRGANLKGADLRRADGDTAIPHFFRLAARDMVQITNGQLRSACARPQRPPTIPEGFEVPPPCSSAATRALSTGTGRGRP